MTAAELVAASSDLSSCSFFTKRKNQFSLLQYKNEICCYSRRLRYCSANPPNFKRRRQFSTCALATYYLQHKWYLLNVTLSSKVGIINPEETGASTTHLDPFHDQAPTQPSLSDQGIINTESTELDEESHHLVFPLPSRDVRENYHPSSFGQGEAGYLEWRRLAESGYIRYSNGEHLNDQEIENWIQLYRNEAQMYGQAPAQADPVFSLGIYLF